MSGPKGLVEKNTGAVILPTLFYCGLSVVGWILVGLCESGVIDTVNGVTIFMSAFSTGFCLIGAFIVFWGLMHYFRRRSSVYRSEATLWAQKILLFYQRRGRSV